MDLVAAHGESRWLNMRAKKTHALARAFFIYHLVVRPACGRVDIFRKYIFYIFCMFG